jgi:hypothetical protein
MHAVSFEIHTVCDNCGRLIKRQVVDAATFAARVAQAEPAVEELDYEDRTLLGDGDLIMEEEQHPVEVFIQHEPGCGHCAGRP